MQKAGLPRWVSLLPWGEKLVSAGPADDATISRGCSGGWPCWPCSAVSRFFSTGWATTKCVFRRPNASAISCRRRCGTEPSAHTTWPTPSTCGAWTAIRVRGRSPTFALFSPRSAVWRLWKVVPMHPSFSPLWLLSLVVGPVLFYKFLRITLGSTPLAQIGTALYFTSQALLSSALFLFHPAKPLTNLALIISLYLAARANGQRTGTTADSPWLPRGFVLAWLTLMPLLLLSDEAVVFCLLVPIAWCPVFFLAKEPQLGQRARLSGQCRDRVPARAVLCGLCHPGHAAHLQRPV